MTPHRPTRRVVLAGLAAAGALRPFTTIAAPEAGVPVAARHGMSIFGDLALAPDFRHFAYADPEAPKGGRIALVPSSWAFNQNPDTFNTMNTLILRGDAPVGLDIIFDSLMVRNFEEPDAVYGLVAREVEANAEGTIYRFDLRPEARWHDGTPLTAEDVAFSFLLLKEKGHPSISQSILDMEDATAIGPHEVEVRFKPTRSRDLPQLITGLPIVSRRYYTDNDFEATTMTPPLGSGPYRVGPFRAGRSVDYVRVPDYWAKDLPVNRGRYNFDVVRYEFYRDRDVAFEAFKAGQYTFREEFTSRTWATGYDFPAVLDGRVKRETLPDETPSGAQGWFINTRRPHLADPRVREALICAFDFEWTNRTLFYGLYERTSSYFENSDLLATGEPSPEELALLEPYRGRVPDEVFGPPFTPPVSDGSGRDRRLLRRAVDLLKEAGWEIEDRVLRNERGEPFRIEFLDASSTFQRVIQPYMRNLEMLGIAPSLRIVDASQYQSRLNDYDFDLVSRRYSMSPTPGEGIKRFWTSSSADTPGSPNLAGIADPVIDELTDRVVNASSREEQVTAARALDRVLRSGRYWIPQWHKREHTIAYWDLFERPAEKPRYTRGVIDLWWASPAQNTTPQAQ
ncbi:extracellular solute-binding protein [Lutibaculum baratangense]|nr:extracellular solute-binding protein [Lutibaculum baratangense]